MVVPSTFSLPGEADKASQDDSRLLEDTIRDITQSRTMEGSVAETAKPLLSVPPLPAPLGAWYSVRRWTNSF